MTYDQRRKAQAQLERAAAADKALDLGTAATQATRDAAAASAANVAATAAVATAQQAVADLRTRLAAAKVQAEAAGLADELETALVALADARGSADLAARAEARAARRVARIAADLAGATTAKTRADAEAKDAEAAAEANAAALATVAAGPVHDVLSQARIALKQPAFRKARDALGGILDGSTFTCPGAEMVSTPITETQIAEVYGKGILGLCRQRAKEAAERVQFALDRASAAAAPSSPPTPADLAAAVQRGEADLDAATARIKAAATQSQAAWTQALADLAAITAAAVVTADAQKGIDDHRRILLDAKAVAAEGTLFQTAREWRTAVATLDAAVLAQPRADPGREPPAATGPEKPAPAEPDPATTGPDPAPGPEPAPTGQEEPAPGDDLATLRAAVVDKQKAFTTAADAMVVLHDQLTTFQAAIPEPVLSLVLRLFAAEQSISALATTSVRSLEDGLNGAESALLSARHAVAAQTRAESRRAAAREARAAVLTDAVTAAAPRLVALVAAQEQAVAGAEADAVLANYLADPLAEVTP